MGQGSSTLKVNFEKNAYTPHDVAKCFVDVDNTQCKLNITDITFQLTRTIKAKAGPHRFNHGPTTLTVQKFPGCAAGASKPTEHMTLDLSRARDPTERVEVEGDVFEEDVQIRNEPLQPSVKGQVIECIYTLSASSTFDGCDCCRNSPTCALNLLVYTQELNIPPPMPMMPPQW